VGVELGAGCGLLSSVVGKRFGVEAMFAVEVCEGLALWIIPEVASHVLGNKAGKVIPVIGSFDALQLPDASVDFIVEIGSLHHADDLKTALSESARVLRAGGWMLCFDRCHPSWVTDEDVERMLSQVYSREFLIANGYPSDVVLTRRQNGEHEYRLFEWQEAFRAASLVQLKMRRFLQQVSLRLAVKGCLSVLPRRVRCWAYRSDNARPGSTWRWLTQWFAALRKDPVFGRPLLAPRGETVFLLQKV